MVVHSVYADDAEPAVRLMRAGEIPVLRRLDDAAAVLVGLHRWTGFCDRPDHSPPATNAGRLALPAGAMLEPAARALLAARGIAMPPSATVRSAAECAAVAARYRGRVALKVVSAAILHKSDRGGVLLDVTPDQAAEGFARLLAVGREAGDPAASVLVTSMAGAGTELVLGGFRDPAFGPVVMLGLGGVLVEALGDVVFRMAPLTVAEAMAMPDDLRMSALLDGYRGRASMDRVALAGMLTALSRLLVDEPSIAEIDLNPVIATQDGLVPVDARIVIGAPLQ